MILKHRLPTLLGILIIFFSLGLTIFLFNNIRNLFGQANIDAAPTEVKITNISDTSFTVSWVTNEAVEGTVTFGENSSQGNIANDDRDQVSGKTGQYSTHHVTLRYLKAGIKYYFKIISGGQIFDNNGEPYAVTTALEIGASSSQAQPAYGSVVKIDGAPAVGTIVYLNIAQATPLSTLVKSSGNWLIILNNVRTTDLADFAKFENEEKIEIFIQGGSDGTAEAKTTVAKVSPVAQISLGKNYDFSEAPGVASPSPAPLLSPSPTSTPSAGGFTLPAAATSSPSLTSPTDQANIPSDRPVFSGTGIPGESITIKVESTNPISGTTTVGQNGNWSWTPPTGLSPGEHTVTITTTDISGQLVKIARKFTVLASGTQVVEAATPSASTRPSPSPTPTPTLGPSPTPVSTAPASGNLSPTVFIVLLGLCFLALGSAKLLLLDKP